MRPTSFKLTLRLRFAAAFLDGFTRSFSGLSCVCQPVVGLSLLAGINCVCCFGLLMSFLPVVGLSLLAGINCVCCFGLLMSFLPVVGLALLAVTVFVLAVEVACAALVVR
jgi:hypothetical protein